ncbi:MAG: hypothetical protein EA382_12480 [Spirochaetaceae bacterium]|nr:MAG: hypothetical protein EA382_12480 [Spirochaetaceae bacterium]
MLLFVALGAVATGTVEERGPGAGQASRPLTILYPQAIASVPVLDLIARYPDEYRGESFNDHAQALARLINGEADLLFTGFTLGYSRYASAGDLVHVVTPVWGASALMTARQTTDLSSLAGGTIYAPFEGSPIDVYLRALLASRGLAGSIRIAYAPFPQAAALVVEGRADAAVLAEPIASRLEIAGQAFRYHNIQEGWAEVSGGERRSPQVSIFARRRDASALHSEWALLARRVAAIVEELNADHARFAAQYADALGFPVPVVERALSNALFDAPDAAETVRIIADYNRVMGLASPSPEFYASVE